MCTGSDTNAVDTACIPAFFNVNNRITHLNNFITVCNSKLLHCK